MSSFRRRLMMANLEKQQKYVYYIINSNVIGGNVYFDGEDTGFTTDQSGHAEVKILESIAKDSYACIIVNGTYTGTIPSSSYYFSISPSTVYLPYEGGTEYVTVTSEEITYVEYRPTVQVSKDESTLYSVNIQNQRQTIGFHVDYISGNFTATGNRITSKNSGSYSGYVRYRQDLSGKTATVQVSQR